MIFFFFWRSKVLHLPKFFSISRSTQNLSCCKIFGPNPCTSLIQDVIILNMVQTIQINQELSITTTLNFVVVLNRPKFFGTQNQARFYFWVWYWGITVTVVAIPLVHQINFFYVFALNNILAYQIDLFDILVSFPSLLLSLLGYFQYLEYFPMRYSFYWALVSLSHIWWLLLVININI